MEAQEDERAFWPDALAAAGIHPPQMQDVADAAAGDLGQGTAASLAMHDALRADLLQGICLFQLAARRSYDGTDPDAAAAHQIVSLLRSRVLKIASEVRHLLLAIKRLFACQMQCLVQFLGTCLYWTGPILLPDAVSICIRIAMDLPAAGAS